MPATARKPFGRFDASRLVAPGALPAPVTILFFESLGDGRGESSDGIVLGFDNTGDIQAAFDLAVLDGVAGSITENVVDGVVYATLDPYAGDIRNRRELLLAPDIDALRRAADDSAQEI